MKRWIRTCLSASFLDENLVHDEGSLRTRGEAKIIIVIVMGCGASTATNGPYPKQQYQGAAYPQQRGGYQGGGNRTVVMGGGGYQGNNDGMAEGMLVGAAVGYTMAGGGGGMMMGGTDLPMGYHMGPVAPEMSVNGVDIM